MEHFYEQSLMIDSRDSDGYGQCRPSALLGHLQEAATQAAETAAFNRKVMMEQYHVFWVLTRIWFQLDRPLMWGEKLTVRTWHRGGKSAIMYRDFDLLSGAQRVGEAVSAWVLMEQGSGKLAKLSTIPELRDSDGGALCKTMTLSKLHMPEGLASMEQRLLRYSDADINGHVNNTKYADFLCDAFHMEQRERGEYVSQMQIGYLKQCWPEEKLELLGARQKNGCFLRGIDESGTVRFDACMALDREK